jgi:hypothetical protein
MRVEVLLPIVVVRVVVVVVVSAMPLLFVDMVAELLLVELPLMLEVEVAALMMLAVDVVVLVVAEVVFVMLNAGVEEMIEEVTIVEFVDVLFVGVSALAKNPKGDDKRRARKAVVMRMHVPISLPKPATSARN